MIEVIDSKRFHMREMLILRQILPYLPYSFSFDESYAAKHVNLDSCSVECSFSLGSNVREIALSPNHLPALLLLALPETELNPVDDFCLIWP